jgi:ABC-type spermidine/putrescine transport system permease subunit I
MTTSTAPTQLAAKPQTSAEAAVKKNRFWSWLIFVAGALYFLVPLAATFYWSLRAEKDKLGFEAYRRLFADTNFLPSFSESIVNAIAAILLGYAAITKAATCRRIHHAAAVRDPGGGTRIRPHSPLQSATAAADGHL